MMNWDRELALLSGLLGRLELDHDIGGVVVFHRKRPIRTVCYGTIHKNNSGLWGSKVPPPNSDTRHGWVFGYIRDHNKVCPIWPPVPLFEELISILTDPTFRAAHHLRKLPRKR